MVLLSGLCQYNELMWNQTLLNHISMNIIKMVASAMLSCNGCILVQTTFRRVEEDRSYYRNQLITVRAQVWTPRTFQVVDDFFTFKSYYLTRALHHRDPEVPPISGVTIAQNEVNNQCRIL